MRRRIGALAYKEGLHILRDWRALMVVLVMPVLMLVLYGYAVNLDVKHLRVAVYDPDGSQASRELVRVVGASESFDVVAHLGHERHIAPLLDRGKVKVVLVFPSDFGRRVARGERVPLQILVDGSDANTALLTIGDLQTLLADHSLRLIQEALRRAGGPKEATLPVEVRRRCWYNPNLRSVNYIVPGLIAVLLMMLSALLTSLCVVRERETGTFETLAVLPIRPSEIILGKLLPYVLIAWVDVALVTLAARWIFHVPFRGSPGLLMALSLLFLTASLGIGLLISVLARSQQVAMLVAVLTTMLPSVLLSGFIFPIRNMPLLVRALTFLIPARHFLVILRGIFLKGLGLASLWPEALMLGAFGVVVLALASRRFEKRL